MSDALDTLAHRIATTAAVRDIQSLCMPTWPDPVAAEPGTAAHWNARWHDINTGLSPVHREQVAVACTYLARLGLLHVHKAALHLVRVQAPVAGVQQDTDHIMDPPSLISAYRALAERYAVICDELAQPLAANDPIRSDIARAAAERRRIDPAGAEMAHG